MRDFLFCALPEPNFFEKNFPSREFFFRCRSGDDAPVRMIPMSPRVRCSTGADRRGQSRPGVDSTARKFSM